MGHQASLIHSINHSDDLVNLIKENQEVFEEEKMLDCMHVIIAREDFSVNLWYMCVPNADLVVTKGQKFIHVSGERSSQRNSYCFLEGFIDYPNPLFDSLCITFIECFRDENVIVGHPNGGYMFNPAKVIEIPFKEYSPQ